MLTPNGLQANKIEKIMLLSLWSRAVAARDSRKFIFAGMGKPTFPINKHTINAYVKYWKRIEYLHDFGTTGCEAAIDYGDPIGEIHSRETMAKAMTEWYKTEVDSSNILFTVGGSGALRVIFDSFNSLYPSMPHFRLITPCPYYSLYMNNRHTLHPIHVMNEPGYRLTGKLLNESIVEARKLAETDKNEPKIILLCNPNNPLGTVISEEELIDIAEVLRQNPDLRIVIDEAYAEMSWAPPCPSLLELAPDLKGRITILRSATKALSAAGERMAMLITFDHELMNVFRAENISMIGHAPKSAQVAYAETMVRFDEADIERLRKHYEPKVRYVYSAIQDLCAAMPDPEYKVDGTFYVMADLSDLFGMDIPPEAEKALGYGGYVKTSEELVYSLLFKSSIMIAPGQYFGLSANKGFCRITCSGSQEELAELISRIGENLFEQRKRKKEALIKKAQQLIDKIVHKDSRTKLNFFKRIEDLLKPAQNNRSLVEQLEELKGFILQLDEAFLVYSEPQKN